MTDLETRLEHALQTDETPSADPMFRIEVLARRERTAFRRLLAVGAVAVGIAMLVALGVGASGALMGAEWLAPAGAAILLLTAFSLTRNQTMLPALRSIAEPWRAAALSLMRRITGPRLWH